MGLLKFAMIGTVAVLAYQFMEKKRATDGKSLLDDINKKKLGYTHKLMEYVKQVSQDYMQTHDLY